MAALLSAPRRRIALATRLAFAIACIGATAVLGTVAAAAPLEPVRSLAAQERAPLLDTLKDLVSIESGSGDLEGLDKISDLIAGGCGRSAARSS